MTASAVLKIVAAECALVVVTRGAARRVAGRKMHRRERRRDLPPARRARFDHMTARAAHRLQMPRVRERRGRVSLCPFGRARRRSGLMTGSARRQRGRGIRRVTLKTARVRVCARRDRKPDAARRLMTARAVRLADVFRVIEPRAEAFQPRKTLDAGRRVADRAERRTVAFGKLLFVTARARDMPHKFRRRRIIAARVADEARQTAVRRVRMFEARKIGLRARRRRQKTTEKQTAAENDEQQKNPPHRFCKKAEISHEQTREDTNDF